eukprot:191774-Amphidinium_carterae.1
MAHNPSQILDSLWDHVLSAEIASSVYMEQSILSADDRRSYRDQWEVPLRRLELNTLSARLGVLVRWSKWAAE